MMSFLCCDNNRNCTIAAVIGSLILGIIGAFLQITDALAVTTPFLWVTFGIGVGILAIALASARIHGDSESYHCCPPLSALLIGALGAILTALILLGIPAAIGGVVGAIFIGLLLFSLFLTLSATACYIRCLTRCNR